MWRPLRSSLFTQFLQASSSLRSPKLYFYHSPLRSRITSNTLSAINAHHLLSPNFTSLTENPTLNNKTHEPLSSKSHLNIGKSIISKFSYLWDKKADTFAENSSLQDILKEYGHLSPETTRRFWRVSVLKPNDFAEILLGFGPDVEDSRKVRFLWNLFRWSNEQCREFRHVSKSFEIMATMLVRARMLKDAELLILSEEARGVFCGDGWMFSEIIQEYIERFHLEGSVTLYDIARERGLELSGSCYKALLSLLIRMRKVDKAVRVYVDMVEVGLGSCSEDWFLEFVVGALSKTGKTLEAVHIFKKLKGFDVKPSAVALDAVVQGYCRKKVYEDVLNFLKEWDYIPGACVCNKIISSLCRNFGNEEAWVFVERLEAISFELDAVTFGILISQSCSERKLRNAFVYLSESFSRGIKLDVHAYNALISGLFKEGMHSCAKDISEEMIRKGLLPGLSTFKLLLAGYCKYRKFDEVKQIIGEIINCGMTSLGPVEDALSKAFQILGLDRLGVKVKRDNDSGLVKAEFFDALGNGLYLETDVEEFDKTLEQILDYGIIPDFDSLILEECYKGDVESALRLKEKAVQWGNNLSLSAFCKLIEGLCASSSYLKAVIILLDETPESFDQFGLDSCNLLIQYLSKNGEFTHARLLLDRLFMRQIVIESDTYTALLLGFCKEKNIYGLQECLQVAQKSTWVPRLTDIKELISFLVEFGMIKEVLEIFDNITEKYRNPNLISDICNAIVKELCCKGFTDVGYTFAEVLCRDHAVSNASYTSLIEGFIKEKKLAKALGIIDQLIEKNMTPSTSNYQLIVPLMLKFKGVRKAMNLKEYMLNAQSKSGFLVYSTLVNEFCRTGNMKEAAIQLHEMLDNKVFPDSNSLNALIQGYCHAKSLRKALEIQCVMLRNNIDLSISGYRSLIRQFCVHGPVLCALSLGELMQVKSEPQSLILHNILIFYLFQSGNSLLVKALLKKMHEKHLNLNEDTYNILVYGSYKCGNASTSVKFLNTMITEGMKPNSRTLRTVICYLCSIGEVNEALRLSKVMECNGWKHGSVVLCALTEGLIWQSGISMAEHLLDRMEQNNMISDTINLDLLIRKFFVHSYTKKAVDLLNVMLKKGNFPSESSYSLVIKGLSIQKLFDQALDFHAEMRYKNLAPSLDSCSVLICGLCDNGRTDDARNVLGDMLRFGPVPIAYMYNYVIDKYYAQNNLNKASELLQEMQQVGYSPNFETCWSLISNLSSPDKKEDDDDDGKGFLSRLLSGNGLPAKNSLSTIK